MKDSYHWLIEDVKNDCSTSDFYASTALLSLDKIVKRMQEAEDDADVIKPNTLYKVIIYESGYYLKSFYLHSNGKGDVFYGRE